MASKAPIRLGLGAGRTPGRAISEFAKLFARQVEETPRLEFWELGSTLKGLFLHQSPLVYLNPLGVKQEDCEYLHVDRVREAIKQGHYPDIILTSASDKEDDHDQIRLELKNAPKPDARTRAEAELEGQQWIGTVQWQPFARTGPIDLPKSVELPKIAYTLHELIERRADRKHRCEIVLMMSHCPVPECNKEKTKVLLALLNGGERLNFFSTLIIDRASARMACDELNKPKKP